jgi:hypothetical protein
MAGLALADGCLRATQTASAHLELKYNGGPCELKQQCKRPDAYLVGEQDAALDNIGHTPNYLCFQTASEEVATFTSPISAGQGEKGTLT